MLALMFREFYQTFYFSSYSSRVISLSKWVLLELNCYKNDFVIIEKTQNTILVLDLIFGQDISFLYNAMKNH